MQCDERATLARELAGVDAAIHALNGHAAPVKATANKRTLSAANTRQNVGGAEEAVGEREEVGKTERVLAEGDCDSSWCNHGYFFRLARWTINGAFMLTSPRAWFELPEWLAAASRGPLTPERHSSGWGALQVRLTGTAFLGTVIWFIYNMFFSR